MAWGLNQVYWSARPAFDRLLDAAGRLREAQAQTLRGQPADLRAADVAHRQAVGDAVAEGARILKTAGHPVSPDTLRSLTAAFEALPWSEPAGRLVRPPAPGGFALFAGMPVAAERQSRPEPEPAGGEGRTRSKGSGDKTREAAAKKEAVRREREATQRQAQEAADEARRTAALAAERLQAADEQLTGAREAERAARLQLEEARQLLQDAEERHREMQREAAAAQAAVRKTDAAAAQVSRRR